jgi:hypothetical protein
MLAAIGAIITSIVNGVVGPLFGFLNKKEDINLEMFRTETGFDLAAYQAVLAANAEANNAKIIANSWWGAHLLILLFGVPVGIHWACLMLVSTFPETWGAGWGWTVKAPAPADSELERVIIQSFYIMAPAMPVLSALAWRIGRRK